MEINTALIYNITNKITHSIHHEWLEWTRNYHIPAVLATGCFFKAVLLKLKGIDDEEGPTYAIQYHAASEADYERYLSDFATLLRQETLNHWGDQFIAFRTVMEVVN